MEWLFQIRGISDKAEITSESIYGPAFQAALALLTFILICCLAALLGYTVSSPPTLKGAGGRDYDALQGGRRSLQDYCTSKNIDIKTTPMVAFSVATANFGGIFTETQSLLQPWTGSVHSDAVRRQVEAGARAVVFDIWPDPADSTKPVICAMLDHREWASQRWWIANGLSKGTGNYSNWRLMTRNTRPVGEVLSTAIQTAFGANPGNQNTDPFFIIMNLHGAMTTDYLDHLGRITQEALGGFAMAPEFSQAQQQKALCTTPVAAFMNRAFVIVIPDIQSGYNSLPSINTYAAFVPALMKTRMGQITNAIQTQPQQITFDIGNLSAISTANQTNCLLGGPQLTPAQAGFCLIQPTIGGSRNDNTAAYANTSWQNCLQSGAQFVAVNLFSTDSVTDAFFDATNFGQYSFKKGA